MQMRLMVGKLAPGHMIGSARILQIKGQDYLCNATKNRILLSQLVFSACGN